MLNRILEISKKLSFLLPYIIVFCFSLLAIETFTFPGVTRRYVFLPTKVLILLVSLITLFFELQKNILSKSYKNITSIEIVFSLNKLFLPVTTFIYIVLVSEEKRHFSNYVFSHYNIHINEFKKILIFNIIIFAISVLRHRKSELKSLMFDFKKKTFEIKMISIIYILIFIIFAINLSTIFDNIIENYASIISSPLASYEQKQSWRIGDIQYFNFLNSKTSETATIMVPPQQSPWLTEGNAGYVRYFLYPRKVISGKLIDNDYSHTDFVLLAKGSWPAPSEDIYGWPKDEIKAKNIWLFDLNTKDVIELKNVIFDKELQQKYKYSWGIIEVEK